MRLPLITAWACWKPRSIQSIETCKWKSAGNGHEMMQRGKAAYLNSKPWPANTHPRTWSRSSSHTMRTPYMKTMSVLKWAQWSSTQPEACLMDARMGPGSSVRFRQAEDRSTIIEPTHSKSHRWIEATWLRTCQEQRCSIQTQAAQNTRQLLEILSYKLSIALEMKMLAMCTSSRT